MHDERNIHMKKTITAILCIIISSVLYGCGPTYAHMSQPAAQTDENGNIIEQTKITYECLFYNNDGNCFIGFTGSNIKIEPNREKTVAYNPDTGDKTYSYDLSSVVTFTIDGEVIPASGSTAILKDSRVNFSPVNDISGEMYGTPAGENGYTVRVDNHPLQTWYGLTNWYYSNHGSGQGGEKIILVQSQDGNDIGIIEGNDIQWKIEETLPKTTRITVDGMPVFIHRCNFMIIPVNILEKSRTYMETMDTAE